MKVESGERTSDMNEDGSEDRAWRVDERPTCAIRPKRAVDEIWKMGKT